MYFYFNFSFVCAKKLKGINSLKKVFGTVTNKLNEKYKIFKSNIFKKYEKKFLNIVISTQKNIIFFIVQ